MSAAEFVGTDFHAAARKRERGAMLVACRLAGLSALEADYASLVVVTQSGSSGAGLRLADDARMSSPVGQTVRPVRQDRLGPSDGFLGPEAIYGCCRPRAFLAQSYPNPGFWAASGHLISATRVNKSLACKGRRASRPLT